MGGGNGLKRFPIHLSYCGFAAHERGKRFLVVVAVGRDQADAGYGYHLRVPLKTEHASRNEKSPNDNAFHAACPFLMLSIISAKPANVSTSEPASLNRMSK